MRGEDTIIEVPLGTVVYRDGNDDNGDVTLGELIEPDQSIVLARGGVGGKGNRFFKRGFNRNASNMTRGVIGEELRIRFELKLLADVALVGFPNAGKSTSVY